MSVVPGYWWSTPHCPHPSTHTPRHTLLSIHSHLRTCQYVLSRQAVSVWDGFPKGLSHQPLPFFTAAAWEYKPRPVERPMLFHSSQSEKPQRKNTFAIREVNKGDPESTACAANIPHAHDHLWHLMCISDLQLDVNCCLQPVWLSRCSYFTACRTFR